jgi:hypothetical protein
VVFHPANLSAVESVAGFSNRSEFLIMRDFFNFLKGFCQSPQGIGKNLLSGVFVGKQDRIARLRIYRL